MVCRWFSSPCNTHTILVFLLCPNCLYLWEHQSYWIKAHLDESLLDCKIKQVNPEGNQPWIFTGRTDAKAEVAIVWPPDEKSQLIGKDLDAGKNWKQKEKGTTEDEMVRYSITDSMNVNLSTLREIMKDREAWSVAVHGVTKSQTRLSDWSELNFVQVYA